MLEENNQRVPVGESKVSTSIKKNYVIASLSLEDGMWDKQNFSFFFSN